MGNLLRLLIFKNPVVNTLHLCRSVLGKPLRIAYYCEGICVIDVGLVGIDPFLCNIKAVGRKVLDISLTTLGIKNVVNENVFCIAVNAIQCRFLKLCHSSYVRISRDRLDLTLEIVAVIASAVATNDKSEGGDVLGKVCGTVNALRKLTVKVNRHLAACIVKGECDVYPVACSYVNIGKLIILNVAACVVIIESGNTVFKDFKQPVLSNANVVSEDRTNSCGHRGINVNVCLEGQGSLGKLVIHLEEGGLCKGQALVTCGSKNSLGLTAAKGTCEGLFAKFGVSGLLGDDTAVPHVSAYAALFTANALVPMTVFIVYEIIVAVFMISLKLINLFCLLRTADSTGVGSLALAVHGGLYGNRACIPAVLLHACLVAAGALIPMVILIGGIAVGVTVLMSAGAKQSKEKNQKEN